MKEFHSAATINASPEAIRQILTDAPHARTGSRDSERYGALSFMTYWACLVEGASPRTRIEPGFSFNILTRIRIKVVLLVPLSPSIPNISRRLTGRVSTFKISREQ